MQYALYRLAERKRCLEVLEPRMSPVLLRQYRPVGGYAPVDGEVGVVPGDGPLGLRGVEAVALVLEDHLLAQHAEPVGETPRDEELPVVVAREFDRHVLAEGRRVSPDVHRHVQYGALYHAHQFGLRVGRLLEMQPSDDPVARPALVVLDEVHVGDSKKYPRSSLKMRGSMITGPSIAVLITSMCVGLMTPALSPEGSNPSPSALEPAIRVRTPACFRKRAFVCARKTRLLQEKKSFFKNGNM